MNEDEWKVGDLALCVTTCRSLTLPIIQAGELHTVSAVHGGLTIRNRGGTGVGLEFEDRPMFDNLVYWARYFVKVTPGADLIEEDRRAEFPQFEVAQ